MTAPAQHDQALSPERECTLLELLDRVLDKGVAVSGDITLSVADIDLVNVGLQMLLSSVESMGSGSPPASAPRPAPPPSRPDTGRVLPSRVNGDPHNVERGLAKLVMTLVELLRQLLERQAIRRMDGGSLSDDQIERLGHAFMKLEQRMEDLKRAFGLEHEDLNLNLGPLGRLMD